MPRRVGYKCDEETRKNMSLGALSRECRLIKRYGLTKEFYDERIAAGDFWCSGCKSFQSEASNSQRNRCKECQRKLNKKQYDQKSDIHCARRRKYYAENRESEMAKDKAYSISAYGITSEQFSSLLNEQGGVCAICGGLEIGGRRFAIDHSHDCCGSKSACDKCRRGILCTRCNVSLERMESYPDWPERARAYLAKYGD